MTNWPRLSRQVQVQWVIALASSGLVLVMTRWVAASVTVLVAVVLLPRIVRADAERRRRLDVLEAVATWTEMVRDTIEAASGLEQAIVATTAVAPEAIQRELHALAEQLKQGERLAVALRRLGDDLHDPTADLVISALVLAADHPTRQLADLLGELAAEAREQTSLRLRIEAGRRQLRTSVRVVVATTIVFAGALVLFSRSYLDPYDTSAGQLVLAVVAAVFAAAFVWIARIARAHQPERFLTGVGGGEGS
ncbi:type II secretion system F family protein [Lentzea sp. JNUCC 0626]|uniref:type II secretion system F family protein n=1 Tax=Lentzea sp. JNUCC 0626 TaxID=3367513 RepID=UPI0037482516